MAAACRWSSASFVGARPKARSSPGSRRATRQPHVAPIIHRANWQIAQLANGKSVHYVNINEELAFPDGHLRDGMAYDGLHLTPKAYQVWADALRPLLTEILGPPAAVDRAPPPTGDPSAKAVTN